MQRIVIIMGFVVGLMGCARLEKSGSKTHVVGGDAVVETDPSKNAYLKTSVALVTADNRVNCTAVVLSDRHLLTAAHCIPHQETSRTKTRLIASFGNDIKSPLSFQRTLKSAYFHASYNARASYYGEVEVNDVAVVTLNEAIPPGFGPPPLMLPEDPFYKTNLNNVKIAGYGYATYDDRTYATDALGKLRVGSVKYMEYRQKSKLHRLVGTSYLGEGSCNGDSGGPAFFENAGILKLIGLTSGGNCLGDSFYTDITSYIGWIEANTGLNVRTGRVERPVNVTAATLFTFPDAVETPPTLPTKPTEGPINTPTPEVTSPSTCKAPLTKQSVDDVGCSAPTPLPSPDPTSPIPTSVPSVIPPPVLPPVQITTSPVPAATTAPVSPPVTYQKHAAYDALTDFYSGRSIVFWQGNKTYCASFSDRENCTVRVKEGSGAPSAEIVGKCEFYGNDAATQFSFRCFEGSSGLCVGVGLTLASFRLTKPLTGTDTAIRSDDFLSGAEYHSASYCSALFR